MKILNYLKLKINNVLYKIGYKISSTKIIYPVEIDSEEINFLNKYLEKQEFKNSLLTIFNLISACKWLSKNNLGDYISINCQARYHEMIVNFILDKSNFKRNIYKLNKNPGIMTDIATILECGILRLGYMDYDTTKKVLDHMDSKIIPGGLIFFEEYGLWSGHKKAIDEYVSKNLKNSYLQHIDNKERMLVHLG